MLFIHVCRMNGFFERCFERSCENLRGIEWGHQCICLCEVYMLRFLLCVLERHSVATSKSIEDKTSDSFPLKKKWKYKTMIHFIFPSHIKVMRRAGHLGFKLPSITPLKSTQMWRNWVWEPLFLCLLNGRNANTCKWRDSEWLKSPRTHPGGWCREGALG